MALKRSRWEAIKALRVVPRLFHLSYQLETFTDETGEQRVIRHGGTLNIGRNKRKREERAGKPRKQWKRVA